MSSSCIRFNAATSTSDAVLAGYQFRSKEFPDILIIVLNNNEDFKKGIEDLFKSRKMKYSYKDVLEEVEYHETREAYWIRQGKTTKSAHILASFETARKFARQDLGGLNLYLWTEIEREDKYGMSYKDLERLRNEDRKFQIEVLSSAGYGEDGKILELKFRARVIDRIARIIASGKVEVGVENRGTILADRDISINTAKDIEFKKDNVAVIAGYRHTEKIESMEQEKSFKKALRNFNSDIKLKFGKNSDNNQVRLFSMAEGAGNVEILASLLLELNKVLAGLEKEGDKKIERIVVYMPEVLSDGRTGAGKEIIMTYLKNIETRNALSIKEEIIKNIEKNLAGEEIVVMKDDYSDLSKDGEVKYPDLAFRFVLAREINSVLRKEGDNQREGFMAIINLLALRSGFDAGYKEELDKITAQIKQGKNAEEILNRIIIKIKPINYEEIVEYTAMHEAVAKSL
ncbi:hypothetical protein OMAG_002665 [Candidatus Omnitrophus magneticus]|uniref:Uncharacterized protein n=1 Tax=Candidatus Omnitrophus magneticus TaxID=1609969 RepID=A0A0F0CPL2_9BACT|nr:hypothetical protein OMAG_002665 [Candidatus Omnitrophus magneticus]